MTIKTKYNTGDKVWIKTLTKGVQKWKIREITIEILENKKYRELYKIERDGLYYIAFLSELFSTKEELLNKDSSILKTLNNEKDIYNI